MGGWLGGWSYGWLSEWRKKCSRASHASIHLSRRILTAFGAFCSIVATHIAAIRPACQEMSPHDHRQITREINFGVTVQPSSSHHIP